MWHGYRTVRQVCTGFGLQYVLAETRETFTHEFRLALARGTPTVIEAVVAPTEVVSQAKAVQDVVREVAATHVLPYLLPEAKGATA